MTKDGYSKTPIVLSLKSLFFMPATCNCFFITQWQGNLEKNIPRITKKLEIRIQKLAENIIARI